MNQVKIKTFKNELNIAKRAAEEAGKILLKLFLNKNHVIRKSAKELVSGADIESQKIIEVILKNEFPNYQSYSEEKRVQQDYSADAPFWIIDPLDGTHNYIAGLPFYGVSIALADIHNFYLGVIYLPFFDSLFWAVKDSGAYCNEAKIKSSQNSDLSKSMIAYDNHFHLNSNSFKNYKKLVDKSFTTRITGSAVYDLCLAASGKIDARIWNNTKICDVAAGVTIISEAGGSITDFNGAALNLSVKDVIASNGRVHNEIITVITGGR
ncbi:MAG: inositol monophosphatase [bacterium]